MEERNQKSGYNGAITNVSLHDVIQLICIGRNTCRMKVRSGSRQGSIFFRDGEIVHAEEQEHKGEDAFFNILSWDLGEFVCDRTPTDEETMGESWDFLLMESVRRIDRQSGS